MILRTNVYGLRNNPDLLTFLTLYSVLGVRKTNLSDRAVEYDFAANGHDDLLSYQDLTMLIGIGSNLWIRSAIIYSSVVSEAFIDGDVPEGWVDSTVPVDEETTRQKTYREYTLCHPVEGGYIMQYGHLRNDGNMAELTNAEFRAWEATAGFGYKTKANANQMIQDYITANSTPL